MPNDKAESNIATSPPAGEQQSELARQTFANPKEFLQVLQNDFGRISHDNRQITKGDLLHYEQHGDNPDHAPDVKGRAAAAIALESDHYEQLVKMANPFPGIGDPSAPTGLTADGLALDMRVYEGSVGWDLASREAGDASMAIAGVVGTLAGISATAAVVHCPPLVVVFGAMTAEMILLTVSQAVDMYYAPGALRDNRKTGQQELGSWKEINTKAGS